MRIGVGGFMKLNKLVLTVLVFSMLVLLAINLDYEQSMVCPQQDIYVVSGDLAESLPIEIMSDDDFQHNENITGEGTIDLPYIIEDFSINLNNTEAAAGIKIYNTDAHVIIRNCAIQGINRLDLSDGPPGYLEIIGTGIELYNTSNVIVRACRIFMVSIGIHMIYHTDTTLVEGNIINGNPLGSPMDYGSRGIVVTTEANGNKIASNRAENCSIGISVTESSKTQVEGNVVTNSDGAMFISTAPETFIYENNCSFNTNTGISITSSPESNVTSNVIDDCGRVGIVLYACENITVKYNIVSNHSGEKDAIDESLDDECGLFMHSGTWNSIIWNNFINNDIEVQNNIEGNLFDYNYYSDYTGVDTNTDNIGDSPYNIAGNSPTQDIHPRMTTAFTVSTNGTIPESTMILIAASTVAVVLVVAVVLLKKR